MDVESNDYMLIGCGGPNIGGVYKSDYDIVNWEFKGPEYQTVYDIAIDSEENIFISCIFHIYKSIDNGNTWEDIHFYTSNLVSIEIDQDDGIWVGFWGGILYSNDCGISWDTVLYTTTDEEFTDFAFGPNDEVYAVSQHHTAPDGGFYRSFDGGITWENVGLIGVAARVMKTNSQNVIYVGCYYDGLFRSNNNGDDWELIYDGIDVVTIEIDEIDRIYIGSDAMIFPVKGIRYSDDYGQTWDTIDQTGLQNKYVKRIYLSNEGHLYAVCNKSYGTQLFKTVNPITGIITNNEYHLEIIIYPNPCSDFLNIKTKGILSLHTDYAIYNNQGVLLYAYGQLDGRSNTINTKYLKDGIYYLVIYSHNFSEVFHFIKKDYR